MQIKKVKFSGTWPYTTPLKILSFIIFFTISTRIFLGYRHWLSTFGLDIFINLTLASLLFKKKVPLKTLGLSNENIKQNLILGCFIGGLMISSPSFLNSMIEILGLYESNPSNQQTYSLINEKPNFIRFILFGVILRTLIDQLFFFGFVLQPLFKKYNPYLVIYFGGFFFPFIHKAFTLPTFFLGLFSAGLYYLTGTLITSILFQFFFLITGYVLKQYYPELERILEFLF